MLYDGAISFMEQGKAAMARCDFDKQNTYLQRAQKIVVELMSCLDMERGGEISQNLKALYGYAFTELVQANIHSRPEHVDHALRVFTQIRESWVQIDENLKKGEHAAAA